MNIFPNKKNRIGFINSHSDLTGYTVSVNEDDNCICPKPGEDPPFYLSIADAKAKLKKFGVQKAYMTFDCTYDEVGTNNKAEHNDWMPINLD